MYVIQDCSKTESHGTIMAKGATIEKAFDNLKKKHDWIFDPNHYGSDTLDVTRDENYIYIDGRAEYEFNQI